MKLYDNNDSKLQNELLIMLFTTQNNTFKNWNSDLNFDLGRYTIDVNCNVNSNVKIKLE